MNGIQKNLIAIAFLLLGSGVSVAQHSLQISDGGGHPTTLLGSNPGGTFTFPSGSGVVLTSSGGVSPTWLVGGNNNPASPIMGTLTNDNFSFITNGVVRATFAGTPTASTPMLTITNTTPNIQGFRINGVPGDAVPGNTLIGNPGVWDVVVDGDEVVTGILKAGAGSLWFDGKSATHKIASDKPFEIKTTNSNPITLGTANTNRLSITAGGAIGIGTAIPSSMLHVVGTPPDPTVTQALSGFYLPDPFNHVVTVENMATNGKGNGIAVIIHNPTGTIVPDLSTSDGFYNDNKSNYVTFYNDIGDHNHIKGRIEGFSYENYRQLKAQIDAIQSNTDLYNPFNYFTFNVAFDPGFVSFNPNFIVFPDLSYCTFNLVVSTVDIPCGLTGGSISSPISFNGSPLTNLTTPFSLNTAFLNSIAAQFQALPYKEKAAMIATNKVQAAINFGLSFLGGVTYETGSGDYAEWLERADHNETINIGDVVGVVGGKISKNTEGADRFMVVSWKPGVLGNMPEAGKEEYYNKVAFMGQIPVKTLCSVKKGDYIIPDGHNQGFAKAISPDQITAEDLGNVLGIAWDDAPEIGAKFVKIAVGLKSNEMVKVIQDQQNEIGQLETKLSGIDKLKAKIAALQSSVKTAKTVKAAKKKTKRSTELSSN
jgi:uncharacterized small protein (DUF1192 family)